MADFSWKYLTELVNEIKPESNFLTGKLIGNKKINEDAEQVMWDAQTGVYKPAPLSQIGDPATKVDVQLHVERRTAVAPQIFLEDQVRIYDALTGPMPGQNPIINVAKLNANDRQRLAYKAAELRKMIDRRVELMVAQIITTGKITNGSYTVDFGVPAANITSASTTWDTSGFDIYKDLLGYVRAYAKLNGFRPDTIIVGSDVADVMLSNDELRQLLDNRNISIGGATVQWMNNDQVIYHGNLKGIGDIYEYVGSYQDDSGTLKEYIPTDVVILANSNAFELHYGAIADYDAGGFVKRSFFSKLKTSPDGKSKALYVESHPLPVLKMNLATMTVTVL